MAASSTGTEIARPLLNERREGELSHIHILGASGSGTSTLARAIADFAGYRPLDTDDFYWQPSDPPFQKKRPVSERIALLRDALAAPGVCVLAGSLCGWGDSVIPFFDLVVFLELDPALRLSRLRQRELSRYGQERIASGGDRHAQYVAFMDWAAQYDAGGIEVRSRQLHEEWLAQLPTTLPVLRLNSARSVDELVAAVLRAAAL